MRKDRQTSRRDSVSIQRPHSWFKWESTLFSVNTWVQILMPSQASRGTLLNTGGPHGASLPHVESGMTAAALLGGGNMDGHSFNHSVNIY